MRALLMPIPLLWLLSSMAFGPVDVALGQGWANPVFDTGRVEPLPPVDYLDPVGGPAVVSPGPADDYSAPRYDVAMAPS